MVRAAPWCHGRRWIEWPWSGPWLVAAESPGSFPIPRVGDRRFPSSRSYRLARGRRRATPRLRLCKSHRRRGLDRPSIRRELESSAAYRVESRRVSLLHVLSSTFGPGPAFPVDPAARCRHATACSRPRIRRELPQNTGRAFLAKRSRAVVAHRGGSDRSASGGLRHSRSVRRVSRRERSRSSDLDPRCMGRASIEERCSMDILAICKSRADSRDRHVRGLECIRRQSRIIRAVLARNRRGRSPRRAGPRSRLSPRPESPGRTSRS
jgi:hypothetical protein